MTHSMTGFATAQGDSDAASWMWELRGVNGKGLDLRLRLPDGIEGLDQSVRARLTKSLGRGNVTVSLKITQRDAAANLSVDPEAVDRLLGALATITARAEGGRAFSLEPARTTDILSQRGVLVAQDQEDDADLIHPLLTSLDEALAGFVAMRAAEGQALEAVLTALVDDIEALTMKARGLLGDRQAAARANLDAALERLIGRTEGIEPDRLAQELALLSVKSDIAEELDRLDAHITAARGLLAATGPIGRKFDFLAQEFNREANTLCSKSGQSDLTAIGLELKVLIDRLREQVQNVE